jgi:hypothetical protein
VTRARATRLLQIPDLDVGPVAAEARTAVTIPKPQELTWWDWAVFLLHTAAEVEHALMIQYLYGAYSLADADFAGHAVPSDAADQTAAWRDTITAIAREEMAHLLTEQNLLRFIGGPSTSSARTSPSDRCCTPSP